MNIKIAVSGAHGTGKTTLCETLEKRFDNPSKFSICREVPRVIINHVGDPDFFKRGNNSITRQMLIFLYQMEEERAQGLNSTVLLCDRTPVDHLAYTLSNHPEFERTPEYTALERIVADWLKTFELIYKVPIEFPLKDDGVREGEAAFQREIDQIIDGLYEKFGIEPTIVTGSVEHRSETVAKVIQNHL